MQSFPQSDAVRGVRCVCAAMFFKLDGIPEPPEGYVPPLGSSRNTWTNIYKNKGRIDYCVQQFGVSLQRHPSVLCVCGCDWEWV